jgi:hypothetical protein
VLKRTILFLHYINGFIPLGVYVQVLIEAIFREIHFKRKLYQCRYCKTVSYNPQSLCSPY